MLAMKNYVREALVTAALFGSIGTTLAQTPPANTGNAQSPPSPKVPGRAGVAESSAQPQPAPGPVFVDGKLNVPNAPADSATRPSKFSADKARLDALPVMARGPALTDAQRKLILQHVKSAGTAASVPYAGPTTRLPATAAMQPWPRDVVSQVPSLSGTKYVVIPGKVLLVRPDTAIVVGEIDR